MKLFIVCVRDITANVFGQPKFVTNLGGAIRGFSDEINRDAADNIMYQHPEDFELYDLGFYDDSTAEFTCAKPRQIAVGKDCFMARVAKDAARNESVAQLRARTG